jgi:hypothetical protein
MIKIKDLKPNPDNPRKISQEALDYLIDSIKRNPKFLELRPIIVDENNMVIAGHQRLKALKALKYTEIYDIWVKKASDFTEEELKEFIVQDNHNVGEWDAKILEANWGKELIKNWGEEKEPDDDKYTKKIIPPTYTPSDKKPDIKELFEDKQTQKLIKKINSSKIPEAEKEFLIKAAYRHSVFDYSKIADYYAHSNKNVQALMEDSALVIIDFKKAIEQGYVDLSQEIIDSYLDDYGKQE